MKKSLLSICLFVVLTTLVGCGGPNTSSTTSTTTTPSTTTEEYLTVSEAYQMALEAGDEGTSSRQYVYGTVKNITNPTYGEMYITDGSKDLYVYGVYSSDGIDRYVDMAEKPYKGDEVYLYGYLKTYQGSPELGASWLQRFVSHQQDVDLSEYEEVTIATARNKSSDSKVIVEGVVSYITYANGMKANGFYLVDETQSIYIYGMEITSRVRLGQKVKLAGIRENYINSSEASNAERFGYQGSIQLKDAIFISATGSNLEFSKDWISESTIKQMLETPMSTNITTTIYKVNGIVNKVPGSGFVNYYIDDLDNKTGSYCYTACNGSDFNWLDAYDGKICTIYLSAINCKATSSGMVYRFIPVLVEENQDFSMTKEEIASFALEYYVKPQFKMEYNSDPELVVIREVNNDYIPFAGVSISYTSSNTDLLTFNLEDEGLIMHTYSGNDYVNIQAQATYQGVSSSANYRILVNAKELPPYINIAAAIALEDDSEVTVRGIVMSGVVNQTAFYLNDGTGVIAVRTDSTTIKNIALGDEIIVSGVRKHVVTSNGSITSQSCIDGAILEVNLYGSNNYDTRNFITNLSFEEVYDLSSSAIHKTDLTTNVYVVECYIKKVESTYYTNFYLTNEDQSHDILLYASSGSQYSIYNEFADGRLLTVAFAFCDWNYKSQYRGCIVSASDGTKTIVNNYNFR